MLAERTAEKLANPQGCWKTIVFVTSGYDSQTGMKNSTYLDSQLNHNQRNILEMQDEQIQKYKAALQLGFDLHNELNQIKQLQKQLVESLYQKRHYLMEMMKRDTESLVRKRNQMTKLTTDQTEFTAPRTLSNFKNTSQSSTKDKVISIFRKNTMQQKRQAVNRTDQSPSASKVDQHWIEHPTPEKRNRIELSNFDSNKSRVHRLSIDQTPQDGGASRRTAGTFSKQARPTKTDYLSPPVAQPMNQLNIQCNESQVVYDEDYHRSFTENSDYQTYLKLRENQLARQQLNAARLNQKIVHIHQQPPSYRHQFVRDVPPEHPIQYQEQVSHPFYEATRDTRHHSSKVVHQRHSRHPTKINIQQLPRRSQKIGDKKLHSRDRIATKSSREKSDNERKEHRRLRLPQRHQYKTEFQEPKTERHIPNEQQYIKTQSDQSLNPGLSKFLYLLSQCILLNEQSQKLRVVLKHVHSQALSLLGLSSGTTNHRKLVNKLVSIIHTKRSYDLQQIQQQVAWMFPQNSKITQQQVLQHLRARPHSKSSSPPRSRRDLESVSQNLKKFFCSLAQQRYFQECAMDAAQNDPFEVQKYLSALGNGKDFSQFDLFNSLKETIDCALSIDSVELFLEQRLQSAGPYRARDLINWLKHH